MKADESWKQRGSPWPRAIHSHEFALKHVQLVNPVTKGTPCATPKSEWFESQKIGVYASVGLFFGRAQHYLLIASCFISPIKSQDLWHMHVCMYVYINNICSFIYFSIYVFIYICIYDYTYIHNGSLDTPCLFEVLL